MRRLPTALLPFLLTALPAQTDQEIWHTDFAAARKLAATTKAPLFVTFRCER